MTSSCGGAVMSSGKNPKTALSSSSSSSGAIKKCSRSSAAKKKKKKGLMMSAIEIEREKNLESSAAAVKMSESESERNKMLALKCTVTQMKRETKETVYAVFGSVYTGQYEYLIYKLDSSSVGNEELVMPIEILGPGKYPMGMHFFSVGSKFYFIGGQEESDRRIPYYTTKAYMFDTNSNQPTTVAIDSMKCPKPYAHIFGPVNDGKVYVFCGSAPSFEVLDTCTDTWESLKLPDFLSGVTFHASSVLCGSNILICDSTQRYKYVFCTITKNWRQTHCFKRNICEPYRLPFIEARPLFHGKAIGQVFIASRFQSVFPEVYSSPNLPPVTNAHGEDYVPVGPFVDLGWVEDPIDLLNRNLWDLVNFYCFKDKICLFRVPMSKYKSCSNVRFAINICDVTFFEGHDVKVKVKNTSQFSLNSKHPLYPRHLHVVA